MIHDFGISFVILAMFSCLIIFGEPIYQNHLKHRSGAMTEIDLINAIRNDTEGNNITIYDDRSECRIEVQAAFTNWEDRAYLGASLLVCLSRAYADLQEWHRRQTATPEPPSLS